MATPRRKTHLSILADQGQSQSQSQSQSFRFTPRGPLSRAPRPWDRKPSAPLNSRSRNREVWKRVLFTKGGNDDDDNGEKDGRGAERGVKRMRVEGGSGLATTKWEGGGERSRKLRRDAMARDEMNEDGDDGLKQMEAPSLPAGTNASEWHHNTNLAYHRTEAEHTVNEVKMPDTQARPTHRDGVEQMFSVTLPSSLIQDRNAPTPQTITESTFLSSSSSSPSSRHRYHGLEGDIADVLSDFLSKARAKRAANSAALKSENTETNSDSSSNSKSQDEDRKKPSIRLHRVSGTPKRRALDVLDKNTNTPSPARSPLRHDRAISERNVTILKVSMAAAADDIPENTKEDEMGQDSEDEDEANDETNDDGVEGNDVTEGEKTEVVEQPATPPRRRTRSGRKPSPPRVRTINLRRPTGNEFVFQPRTDAQQLALSTKSNTRKNKGKAKAAQTFLKEQAQQRDKETDPDVEDAGNNEGKSETEKTATATRKKKKCVHFDDDHLVSFFEEPEQKFLSLDDVSTPSRRLRKRPLPLDEEADSGDDRKAPLPLFSPSVPRKVRRLGPAKKKQKKKGLGN